jgi:S1-C subfamily serine protease
MINRIATWIGGGLVTGALALASSGSTAQHSPAIALQSAQHECDRAGDELAVAGDRLEAALAALEARVSVAPRLAAEKVAMQTSEIEAALATAQDEAGQNYMYFSSDEEPGWLGIRMEEVGSAKSRDLKLPAERGALVTYVSDDSPAAKAGLKVNDVITEFNGQRVEGTMALQRMVREMPAGRTVGINVWRDGRSQTISVEMGSRHSGRKVRTDGDFVMMSPDDSDFDIRIAPMPAIPAIPAIPSIPAIEIGPWGGMRAFGMFGGPLLGIDAEDLSGQLGSYFGAPDGQGVLVREVMPGSSAEKAGLKAGDVILRVDGKRVKSGDDLRSALRDKMGKAPEGADSEKTPVTNADLTVLRAGKEIAVRVELQYPQRKVRSTHRVAV